MIEAKTGTTPPWLLAIATDGGRHAMTETDSTIKRCACGCGSVLKDQRKSTFAIGHYPRTHAPRMADCHPTRKHCGRGFCKSCLAVQRRQKRAGAPSLRVRVLAKERIWKRAWAEKNRPLISLRNTANRYGLTVDQVRSFRAGRCQICGSLRHPHIDHDHETGKVRGCLCAACNVFVGHLAKYPEKVAKAMEYLNGRS